MAENPVTQFVYVDHDLNVLTLPCCATVLYAKRDGQDDYAAHWLLTPLTYVAFWNRVLQIDKSRSMGLASDDDYYDAVMRWDVIDGYARRIYSEGFIEGAMQDFTERGLHGELPPAFSMQMRFPYKEPDEILEQRDDSEFIADDPWSGE
jgi:hypothetical protein